MPPPGAAAGIAGWCRDRLFSSPLNIVLTVLVAWLLFMTLPALIDWLFLQADFSATSAAQCRAAQGACWAFIAAKHRLIRFGLYSYDEQWRPFLAAGILFGVYVSRCLCRFWCRWEEGGVGKEGVS